MASLALFFCGLGDGACGLIALGRWGDVSLDVFVFVRSDAVYTSGEISRWTGQVGSYWSNRVRDVSDFRIVYYFVINILGIAPSEDIHGSRVIGAPLRCLVRWG